MLDNDISNAKSGKCDAKAVEKVYRKLMGGGAGNHMSPLGHGKVPDKVLGIKDADLKLYLGSKPQENFSNDERDFAVFLGAMDHGIEVVPQDLKRQEERNQKILKLARAKWQGSTGVRDVMRLLEINTGLDAEMKKLIPVPFTLFGINFTGSPSNSKTPNDYMTMSEKRNRPNLPDYFFQKWYIFRKERYEKLRELRDVCACRAYEGAFINFSIDRTRKVLTNLVNQATRGRILPRPAFNDKCITKQCKPWGKQCFQDVSNDVDVQWHQDAMFDRIVAKKPLLAVFCVFNLSRTANNPPPTPYIDLLGLRQLIAMDEVDVSKVLSLLVAWIEFYRHQLGPVHGLAMEQLQLLQVSAEDYNSEDKNKRKAFLLACQQLYKLLDTVNASSAIGTLEFVDNIAKFGKGAAPCGWTEGMLNGKKAPIDDYVSQFKKVELLN